MPVPHFRAIARLLSLLAHLVRAGLDPQGTVHIDGDIQQMRRLLDQAATAVVDAALCFPRAGLLQLLVTRGDHRTLVDRPTVVHVEVAAIGRVGILAHVDQAVEVLPGRSGADLRSDGRRGRRGRVSAGGGDQDRESEKETKHYAPLSIVRWGSDAACS